MSRPTDIDLSRPPGACTPEAGADCAGGEFADLDLSGAALGGIDFTDAHLDHTRFTDADLTGATFDGANLDGVIWIASTCPDGEVLPDDFTSTCLDHLVGHS